jgi:hypothetical protein
MRLVSYCTSLNIRMTVYCYSTATTIAVTSIDGISGKCNFAVVDAASQLSFCDA